MFVGGLGPEISSGKGNDPSGRYYFKNEPLIAKQNRYGATSRMVTGMLN